MIWGKIIQKIKAKDNYFALNHFAINSSSFRVINRIANSSYRQWDGSQ